MTLTLISNRRITDERRGSDDDRVRPRPRLVLACPPSIVGGPAWYHDAAIEQASRSEAGRRPGVDPVRS